MYFSSKYQLRESFEIGNCDLKLGTYAKRQLDDLFTLDAHGKVPIPDIANKTLLGIRLGKLFKLFKLQQHQIETLALHIKISKVFLEARIYTAIYHVINFTHRGLKTGFKAYMLTQCSNYVKLASEGDSAREQQVLLLNWLLYIFLGWVGMNLSQIGAEKMYLLRNEKMKAVRAEVDSRFLNKKLAIYCNYSEECTIEPDYIFSDEEEDDKAENEKKDSEQKSKEKTPLLNSKKAKGSKSVVMKKRSYNKSELGLMEESFQIQSGW